MITARWTWAVGVVVLTLVGAVGSAAALDGAALDSAAGAQPRSSACWTRIIRSRPQPKMYFKARRACSFRLEIICGGGRAGGVYRSLRRPAATPASGSRPGRVADGLRQTGPVLPAFAGRSYRPAETLDVRSPRRPRRGPGQPRSGLPADGVLHRTCQAAGQSPRLPRAKP